MFAMWGKSRIVRYQSLPNKPNGTWRTRLFFERCSWYNSKILCAHTIKRMIPVCSGSNVYSWWAFCVQFAWFSGVSFDGLQFDLIVSTYSEFQHILIVGQMYVFHLLWFVQYQNLNDPTLSCTQWMKNPDTKWWNVRIKFPAKSQATCILLRCIYFYILVVDIWEHGYYFKHAETGNLFPNYLKHFI